MVGDPAFETRLEWRGGESFDGVVGEAGVVLDGEAATELSPMQAVAAGLAGCMAIDVVMILEKGRQPLESLRLELSARRAPEPPRRFVEIEIRFLLQGELDIARVERAIELSKEKYCSVWHSLRPDIVFSTRYEIGG
jgi:putative redox protein